MTEAEIVGEYPTLDVASIRAAAAHSAELARDEYPAVALEGSPPHVNVDATLNGCRRSSQ